MPLADKITADLATPLVPLKPDFPLETETTGIVLYPGDSQELRVRWTLQAIDRMRYGTGFPTAGGRPQVMLRLRRLRDDGGADTAQEISLGLRGIGGHGDATFHVGEDYVPFEAELGLVNSDGGWLSLARSNRLQHATGRGLDSLDLNALGVRTGRRTRSAMSERSIGDAPPVHQIHPPGRLDTPDGQRSQRLSADTVHASPPGDRAESIPLPVIDSHAPDAAADGQNATPAPSLIPTLIYGKPASAVSEPVIEAELHIHGWAAPNSEIDLFGHRYCVGPGGRFALVLKVDDPDLLEQALTHHPPAQLKRQRDG